MTRLTRRELFQIASSVAPAFWLARGAAAQTPPALELYPIGSKLTLLSGAGGNIAILQGEDGLLLVDSGLPQTAEAVDQRARSVGPASITVLINTHFHGVVSQSNEFIFVSAFYLMLNTQTALASYAAAGHPSPFFADRSRNRVDPLLEDLHNNPALGLFPDSHYDRWTKSVIPDDFFVLFTQQTT